MAKLTDLPAYDSLTTEEKKRLKEIHGDRLKEDYNWGGELSISNQELKRAEKEVKNG